MKPSTKTLITDFVVFFTMRIPVSRSLPLMGSHGLQAIGSLTRREVSLAYVSIPDTVSSLDKTFHIVSGGHLGVVTGASAPDETWQILLDWLPERSG